MMLTLIEKHRVTHGQFVHTMFIRALKLPDQTRLKYDVNSLVGIIHAGAPCPVAVKRQMIEWLGPIVDEYYAGTESNGITYIHSGEWLENPGSVGRPLVGQVHILDEEDNELPTGEVGRFVANSAQGDDALLNFLTTNEMVGMRGMPALFAALLNGTAAPLDELK